MWSMWKKKRIEKGCISFAFKYILPDQRVQDWPLMETPGPILTIILLYMITVHQGPKLMESQKPLDISSVLVVYNFALVGLSAYMFYEVSLATSW